MRSCPTPKALSSVLSAVSLLAAYCSLFFGISSCASIPPETIRVSESLTSASRDPVELVESLEQRAHQFRSLRALASVYYQGGDGRGVVQEAIVVYRPDRLRLETLSHLGAILVVTAEAGEMVGFHPRDGLFYRGRSSKENIFRYTRIPLELRELTSLLMGLPPLEARDHWEGGGQTIHKSISGGGREVIEFHPSLGIPTKWERSQNGGQLELKAIFSNFSSTSAGLFPLKIAIEAPAQQRRVEIRYQDPELNIDLPSSLFVQEKPANAREILLESLGG